MDQMPIFVNASQAVLGFTGAADNHLLEDFQIDNPLDSFFGCFGGRIQAETLGHL